MTTVVDRPKNPRGEGGRLRGEILAAAAELLDETGRQESVTLRAVARRVGITAPSIYGHFPDRESILLAIVRGAFTELTAALQGAETAAARDPAVQLRAVSEAYLGFAQRRPQRYRVMFGGLYDVTEAVQTADVSQAEAEALGQDALSVFVDLLQACADSGRSRSVDPQGDAITLWVALHGLAHQRAAIPHFPWPDDVADRIVTRVALLGTADRPL